MIKIYFGPKKEFQKKINRKKYTTSLSELVGTLTVDKNSVRHDFPGVEHEQKGKSKIHNLIGYTEDYSGLSDSGIQVFMSILESFDIVNIYLQNPPQHIVDLLNKSGKKIIIEEYEYPLITIETLKEINDTFSSKIIGQEQSKLLLLNNLYVLAANKNDKPLVLMFYGPSGVGKTETAKYLGNIFNQEIMRKQFSMFQTRDFSDYVFGASHSKSSLARDLLERESNIILFDEFDKPDPVFFSAFYQLFDEGIYIDKNYNVTLKKSIIICTSNYLSENDIKNALGEPIYYRFDDLIKFESINFKDMVKIVEKEYETQYSMLTVYEKNIVDANNSKDWILSNIHHIKNVRHARKVIRQRFSNLIIKEVLDI